MSTGWTPYLDDGETLLWEGQPSQQPILLNRRDALFIPFSIVWAGGVGVLNLSVWAQGAPLLFKLWSIPFLLVGLYLLVGRFFIDHRIRAKTYYALSNRRAFIATSAFGRKLRDLIITRDTRITLVPGTQSTIIFGVPSERKSIHGPIGEFSFRAIKDGAHVHRLIREIQGKSA